MPLTDRKFDFSPYLDGDESSLWFAVPKVKYRFTKTNIFIFFFGLFFTFFALIWMLLASTSSIVFALFGIPFLLVGISISFGLIIISRSNLKHTAYIITKKRIIIKSGNRVTSIQNIYLNEITNMEITLYPNNFGTINIYTKSILGNNANKNLAALRSNLQNSLSEIADADQVFKLIKELKKRIEE